MYQQQAPGAPVREDLLSLAAYEQVSLRRGQGFIGFEPGTSISLSCVGRKYPSDDRLLGRHPLSARYDRLSRLNAGGDLPGSVSPEETAQGPPYGCPWSTKGARRAGGAPGRRPTSHVDKGVPRVDHSIWEGCSVSYYPHPEKGGRSLPHALEIYTKRRKFILVGPQCLLIRE